jgi:CRP/FNR family transcriptional regulator, cyclic AMP receptor protein
MTDKKLPSSSGTLEVLKKSKLLQGADLTQLNKLVSLASEVEYKPGEAIVTEGDEAKKLYIIEKGLADVLLELGTGRMSKFQTVSDYDVIGWSAMVPPHIYSSTVKAIHKTKALAFDGQVLRDLAQTDRDLGYALYNGIVGIVAERLRNTRLQLIGIT